MPHRLPDGQDRPPILEYCHETLLQGKCKFRHLQVFQAQEIISKSKDDGEVMAVKHKDYNVYGLQFHPESILTNDGITLMRNFLEKVERGIL